MYLYYPLLNLDDKIYDCSGSFDALKDASAVSFPATITDSLYINTETTSIPVSSYFVFSGSSRIESDYIITMPSNFTITFWLRKTTSTSTVQTIFRAGAFRIYVLSTNLYIEYSGVYYTVPITLNKWGFFSIRQGEVDVYNYDISNKLEDNKRILHITSSYIETSTTPISFIENTSSGGYDPLGLLPTIHDKTSLSIMGKNTEASEYVFARNFLNSLEKDSLFNNDITNNKFYLLENFSGTLCEFRMWDNLVSDVNKRMIQRGSYIYSGEGDLTQNIVNVKARIENIREVNPSKNGIDFNNDKSTFMHSQSVSTLSTHNEFLRGELFSLDTINESFPTQESNLNTALTIMGLPTVLKDNIFSPSLGSSIFYPPAALGYLTNSAYLTQNSYIKVFDDLTGINITPGDLYYVQITYLVSSSDCEKITVYSDSSDSNFILESIPTALEQKTTYGIIKANENGEFFIEQHYPLSSVNTLRNISIFDILCINVSNNGLFDFLDENGFVNNTNKSLNLFLTFKKALEGNNDLRYLRPFSSEIRIFPVLQEQIYNLANIDNVLTSSSSSFQNNEELYIQLTNINPASGNYFYEDLGLDINFVENLKMTEAMKSIIGMDKYFISRPDNTTFVTKVSPSSYDITFTDLDINKEYFIRLVTKNISSLEPAYTISPCNFNHLSSQLLVDENGVPTAYPNPLPISNILLTTKIPEKYVTDLPIDDIDIFFAVAKPDEYGTITFNRTYAPFDPDVYPELKILSIYDITITETDKYDTLEKNIDINYLKEQVISSEDRTNINNAILFASNGDTNLASYYNYGVDQWIKGILLSKIIPYIIPTVDSEKDNQKLMEIEFFPQTRRKKYIIQNLKFNSYYSTVRTIPSGTTTVIDYSSNGYDTADKLMYYSFNVKGATSTPITVSLKAKDVLGNILGTFSSVTVNNSSYVPISILIREGWNKTTNNKIQKIVIETTGNCLVKNPVECNLTDNGVEDWLTNYNFRTLVYEDGYSIKVDTNEKKTLWCDNFLIYDCFVAGSGYIAYDMMSPEHMLKTSEIMLQNKMDTSANKLNDYYGYIYEITSGETDAPLSADDFFPVGWIHRSGSFNLASGKRVHGVGIIAGEILETKDIE